MILRNNLKEEKKRLELLIDKGKKYHEEEFQNKRNYLPAMWKTFKKIVSVKNNCKHMHGDSLRERDEGFNMHFATTGKHAYEKHEICMLLKLLTKEFTLQMKVPTVLDLILWNAILSF